MAEKYKAPDIRSLSAFDINKIQQSLNKYQATQGDYRDAPGWDPSQRGFRTQFEIDKREAAAPRKQFQSGKNYGLEDEYRYLVSQGFRPESMQIAQQQQDTTAAAAVEEQQTGYTPTYLDTGESSNPALFINRFGGNKETMAHSGLASVKRAEAAGLSINEIQRMAAEQGVQFGIKAREYIKEKQGPSAQDMFANQIKAMQDMFTKSMQQQQQQYMEMQQAQNDRMAALQQQMQQAMVAQQRPTVAGVQMAQGTGGTLMQIARRGMTGAFGRRGMRISSLNV
jgi:YesN/AraC family two-component response regulator